MQDFAQTGSKLKEIETGPEPEGEHVSEQSTSGSGQLRHIVIGNWKMNGIKPALAEALKVKDALDARPGRRANTDVMICPPSTLAMVLKEVLKDAAIAVGGQDCHPAASGAHTGDISAEMLKDAGASAVIVGHSERRMNHSERDRDVKAKAEAAHRSGLTAIVCVGETAGERAAGLTHTVVQRQIEGSLPKGATGANTILAYEPVWAIGTGLTPTPADVAAVHAAILMVLSGCVGEESARMRILYGGSVKPSNARELLALPNVHGALVGGASLTAADFLGIINTYDPVSDLVSS